ncbi:hypothetical protein [Fischerella thermalis]|jgi:hypothetical protein|uniref:hypothetical protein n=1 Tax=Fischerella thermalis TaxID=372787 RepID=UPI000302A01F|nr:hypothetical protein [Fischerella thermalis]
MKQPKIEIVTEPQPHEVEFVLQQIIKFNSSRASEGNYKHLVIFLRDSDDHIPVLSLSENNNLSQLLRLWFHPGLRLYFLTETKIYRRKVETKAP